MTATSPEDLDKSDLPDRLDDLYASDSDLILSATCKQVELYLLQESTRLVSAEFRHLASQKKERFSEIHLDRFIFGNDTYIISTEDSGCRLSIEVRLIEKKASKLVRKAVFSRLPSTGRITEIMVRTAPEFETLQAKICETVAANFETGYRWLEAHIIGSLNSVRHDTAEELYLRLRKRLPAEAVAYIWLFVVTEGRGFYVPDRRAQEIAVKRAATRKILATSPLELVVEFATLSLDFDRTHSRDAIASKAVLPQAFPLAKYADTGFQIAEQAIYDCRDYLIHPLVVEGATLLTAGYPETVRPEVFEVLEQEKVHLKSILERNASRLRKLLDDLRKQRSLPRWVDAAAGPMGKLLRGFMEGAP